MTLTIALILANLSALMGCAPTPATRLSVMLGAGRWVGSMRGNA